MFTGLRARRRCPMRRRKSLVAFLIIAMVMLPVFAVNADVPTDDVLQVDSLDEELISSSSLDILEADTVENEAAAETSLAVESNAVVTVSADTMLVNDELEEVFQHERTGYSAFQYYSQYKYCCAEGYNAIVAYVKDEAGDYKGSMLFIYDEEYKQWLRYDYGQMMAVEFFDQIEEKSGLILPRVAEDSEGKKVYQSDNSRTKIDESRVPEIMEDDVSGINFAWKDLSEIPFVKDGSDYCYAGAEFPDPDPDPSLDPNVDILDFYSNVTTEINGSKYTVAWTQDVQYDGKAHIWTETTGRVDFSKQNADVEVIVYKDGALIDPSNYSVTCKNNVNVAGYNGKNQQPYFTVSLKGNYRKDSAKMSKEKFYFDIKPCPLESGTLQAKKIVVEGDKVTFYNLCFVFDDGRKVALSKYNQKTGVGSFTADLYEGAIWVTGYNNFFGSICEFPIERPRKVTYEF